MAPEGLNAFGSFVHAAERQLAFIASGKAKNGVFSTLSTKSQTFYTINVFLIAPRDLHYY